MLNLKYKDNKKPSVGISKGKAIVAIFIAIILIHWVGIYFIMKKEKAPVAEQPKEEATIQAQKGVKPQAAAPGAKPQASATPQAATTADVPIEVRKKTFESAGKPLNYAHAVQGDIPELPDSKNAGSGILIDPVTRTVLWAKNPQEGVAIASMTKMMTILLALEDIESGKGVKTDTMVPVTPTAMKIGGSQVYLDIKESFPLGELLKTLAISSANDSAYLVAEFLGGGDVYAFIKKMNERAKELNMVNTNFYNPHGLPGKSSSEDNVGSAEGMALLAEQLLQYPIAMQWASTKFDFFRKDSPNQFLLHNHNRLIGACPGLDGLKTGWIQRSGYCITVTCKRGDERLIGVVTGFPKRVDRDNFMKKLLDWGYRRNSIVKNKSDSTTVAAAPAPAASQKTAVVSKNSKKKGSEKKAR